MVARHALVFVLLSAALAGCTQSPPSPQAIPVIEVSSTFESRLEDGTPWGLVPPAQDACPPDFDVDEESSRILLRSPVDTSGARGVLIWPDRDPEGRTRNQYLTLLERLPHERNLFLQNQSGSTLLIDSGQVSLGGRSMARGESAELVFDYDWTTQQGIVLQTSETMSVRYLGHWTEPFENRPTPPCAGPRAAKP